MNNKLNQSFINQANDNVWHMMHNGLCLHKDRFIVFQGANGNFYIDLNTGEEKSRIKNFTGLFGSLKKLQEEEVTKYGYNTKYHR